MTTPIETLTIENVVASTSINQHVDLEALSTDLTGVRYDPEHFPGLVYRLQEPQVASLIFRSGNIVCTGAKSIADVENAAKRTFEVLDELGLAVPETPDLTVQNIVTTGDFDQPLTLTAMAIGLGLEHVEYEPEQFPGLVYRLDDHDVVVLLFGSGKFVITGGATPADAEVATETIHAQLTNLGLID